MDSSYQDASASVIMPPFLKNIPRVFSAAGHAHLIPAIGMAERAVAIALLDARPTTRRIMLEEEKNYDTATFMNALRVRQVPPDRHAQDTLAMPSVNNNQPARRSLRLIKNHGAAANRHTPWVRQIDRLFTFARLPPSQWRSARTTNAIERLHEEFKRRIKTQTVLPSADTAAMLFWALLASGQTNMRKVDGWQTLATKPIDQPIDLAA